MKRLKKLSALLIALVMMLAMAGTVLADEPVTTTGSITIKNTVEGKEYDLYRIFDLTLGSNNEVAYTINNDWKDFFSGDGSGYIIDSNSTGKLSSIAVTESGTTTIKYINITSDNIAAFASDALEYALKNASTVSAIKTATGTGNDVTVENLDLGYYMVYPQGASIRKDGYACLSSLTSTNPDSEVSIKATYPDIKKTVDEHTTEVGQTVTYTIDGNVPDTSSFETYTYKLHDTMSEGLTFDGVDTVKVEIAKVENPKAAYDSSEWLDVTNVCDIETDTTDPDHKFTVDIPVKNYQEYEVNAEKASLIGHAIKVTYTATVNENAIVKVSVNKAELVYQHTPGETAKTTPKEAKTYSAKIVIDKYVMSPSDAHDTSTKLAGAKFVLLKKETKEGTETTSYYKYTEATQNEKAKVEWVTDITEATVVTTKADGSGEFNGLKDGTYYLKETEAPAGYNKLDSDVKVEVKGEDALEEDINEAQITTILTNTKQVSNSSGTLLPGTGGMGTTILYIAGGILVLAAAVLMVIMNKKSAKN